MALIEWNRSVIVVVCNGASTYVISVGVMVEGVGVGMISVFGLAGKLLGGFGIVDIAVAGTVGRVAVVDGAVGAVAGAARSRAGS